MDVLLTSFSVEVVKIAAEKSKRKSYPAAMVASYPAAMVATAPVALASSVADVPKGAVDKAVERKLLGKRPDMRAAVAQGFSRAGGKLTAGLITTPMFMGGIRKIRDAKTKEQRREGTAQVLASGAVFSGVKGGVEAATTRGLTRDQRIAKVKSLATSRGITGVLAAGLTAHAVAKALKTPKGKKEPGFKQRYAQPAAAGAAISAGKGAWDKIYERGVERSTTSRGLRRVRAAAGGRAVAGALGAVALSEIMRKALKPPKAEKVKKADVGDEARFWQGQPTENDVHQRYRPQDRIEVNFGPQPGVIYDEVRGWGNDRTADQIYAAYRQSLIDGKAETTPSRRAHHYALVDTLRDKGRRVPEPQMRPHVQDKVRAPTMVDTATLAALVAAPPIAFIALSNMEPSDKDKVLREAMDRLIASKHIATVSSASDEFVTDMFDPTTGKIHLHAKSGPAIAAHELGHATAGPLRRKTLQSGMAGNAAATGRVLSVAIPLLALEGMNDGSFATRRELEARADFLHQVGIVTGAMQAPRLAEEAIASTKALKYLQQAGASRSSALRRGASRLLPAYLTYLAPAAAPFIAAKMLRRKARARSQEETR